jgi:hypothetical protein
MANVSATLARTRKQCLLNRMLLNPKNTMPYPPSLNTLTHINKTTPVSPKQMETPIDDQKTVLGVMSYLNDKFTLLEVDNDIQIHIKRVSSEIAGVTIVTKNADGETRNLGIPPGFELRNIQMDETVPVIMDNYWLIVWSGRYELKRDGTKILGIHPQREQILESSVLTKVLL